MKTVRAIVDHDIVTGFVSGDMDGVEVPHQMVALGPERLRFVNNRIIDAGSLKEFHIDELGRLHAVPGKGWKKVEASHDSFTTLQEDGTATVDSHEDVLRSYASTRRWKAEGAGVQFKGKPFRTDRDSMHLLVSAVLAFGNSKTPVKFKSADGTMVDLSGKDLVALHTAAAKHVQDCFAIEAEAIEKIDAGELKSGAQVDGLAWPKPLAAPKVDGFKYHEHEAFK